MGLHQQCYQCRREMLLGQAYRWVRFAVEQAYISRFRFGRYVAQHKLAWELVRSRIIPLVTLLVLIASSSTADYFVSQLIPLWVNIPPLVSSILSLPSQPGLQTFVGVVATALAAITGILISISLVVLQNVGQRFGSRLTRYLIYSEPVGRFILDLLTLTLLFSVWVLLLTVVLDITPYLSVLVLAVLTTLCIVSLVTYRYHFLAMLAPGAAIKMLEREIDQIIYRLPTYPKEGNRSIADWKRRRAADYIADLDDLSQAIASLKDQQGLIETVSTAFVIVGAYSREKHRLAPTSNWFATVQRPISQADRWRYVQDRRMFDQLGYGRPVEQTHNYDWFEEQIFDSVRKALESAAKQQLWEVMRSSLSYLSILISHLFDSQEQSTLARALELYQWLTDALAGESTNTVACINAASSLGHHVIGKNSSQDWAQKLSQTDFSNISEQSLRQLSAPARFEDIIIRTYQKLRLEIELENRIVTPVDWFQEELAQELGDLESELKQLVFRGAIQSIELIIGRTSFDGDGFRVSALYALLWFWHRCLLENDDQLIATLPESLAKQTTEAVVLSSKDNEWLKPLLDEITSCAFLSMMKKQYSDAVSLVTPLAVPTLLVHSSQTDFIDAEHRLIGVCSLAFLLSELRGESQLLNDVMSPILKLLGDDADGWHLFKERWKFSLDPSLVFLVGLQDTIGMKYDNYFFPIWREVENLPKVPLDGEHNWVLVPDNPSEFIRRISHSPIQSIDSCAKEFLSHLLTHAPDEVKNQNSNSA